MSERLTPPKRYDHFENSSHRAEHTQRQAVRNESKGQEKVVNSRKAFKKIRISDYFITGKIDIPFFALSMLLLAIGLVMLLSASYPVAYSSLGDSYSYFKGQLAYAAIGLVAMFIASKLDYKIYKELIRIILPVSILLLIIVLFYNTGKTSSTGEVFRRYIPVFGLFSFQPSEIGKFALVATLSVYFVKFGEKAKTFKWGILFPLLIIGTFVVLIAFENHVSCMILMFLLGASIMFSGGTHQWIFWVGFIGIVVLIIVVFVFPGMLPEYIQNKLAAYIDKDSDPLTGRWQINNSLYAIGSGGLWGVGLGNSKQKYMYVSEPQNDFIFPIVCEELGFLGAMFIILLYVTLVIKGIQIALKSSDKFGMYLTMGITCQIGIQAALNILVVTDTLPNTGIALPFFSSGGTALIMLLFEVGVVLSVSRKGNQRKV